MKYLFLLALTLASCHLSAQTVEFPALDKSPMDKAHYPRRSAYLNYLGEDDPDRSRKITVLYSRPLLKGRKLIGDLIPLNEDYRLGANEATEVTFYAPVEIGLVTVAPGTYTMFAEPLSADKWRFKLSEERFIGGSANRDTSKDLLATDIDVITVPKERESFTIGFQEVDDRTVHMLFEWGNIRAQLPINLSPPALAGDDASPMDLIQFPPMSRLRNFVKPEELAANEPQIRVVYSRPKANGRKIFGELVKFNKRWRLGANETTEITFFNDVMIGGKTVKAGRYGLFADVEKDEWDFVLHKATQSWGNANFNEEDIVMTFEDAKVENTPTTLEALSMTFVDKGDGMVHLVVGWENTMARLPIKLSTK